jgi:hypothetical protein
MVEPRFLDVHSVEKKLKMGSLMVPMINELMWKLKPIPLSSTALVLAATHSVDEIKIKNTQEEMIKKSEESLEDDDDKLFVNPDKVTKHKVSHTGAFPTRSQIINQN